MRAYTFTEAAMRCGLSPRDIRLMVEEGRLRATRRAGTRVVDEIELRRAGLLEAEVPGVEGPVSPPLEVVLARLEEKAAELAEVRTKLESAETRHANEVKALRREVYELRESARGARPDGRRMRASLWPLLGGDSADPDDPAGDGR